MQRKRKFLHLLHGRRFNWRLNGRLHRRRFNGRLHGRFHRRNRNAYAYLPPLSGHRLVQTVLRQRNLLGLQRSGTFRLGFKLGYLQQLSRQQKVQVL